MTTELLNEIDSHVGEVRTESLDMSFGEIINLHEAKELIIQPEYQRLFRWSNQQRSRLIESVLLELPLPPIFLIENEDGVLELIDGLQRTSSVIQFIKPENINLPPLVLDGCDLVKDLNGNSFSTLPMALKLRIKRSSVRAVIIKRQSKPFLKYEMFKRLNTGGELLSAQEIRNCSSRMVGEKGVEFYTFLQRCSENESYKHTTQSIPDVDMERRANEELVLRFFALKNAIQLFKGNVRDWLDDYMEQVLKGDLEFNYMAEWDYFDGTFSFLKECMGDAAFVRHNDNIGSGRLAPAYFEAVTMGIRPALGDIENSKSRINEIKSAIVSAFQSNEFKKNTGPGANTQEKQRLRIAEIEAAVRSALQ